MEAYDWVGQDPTWVVAPGMMMMMMSTESGHLEQRQLKESINYSKTKSNMYDIRTSCVPRSKHSPPRLQNASQIRMFEVKVSVCANIRSQHKTRSEHHVEFFIIKPGGT